MTVQFCCNKTETIDYENQTSLESLLMNTIVSFSTTLQESKF